MENLKKRFKMRVSEICARDKNLITGIPLHSDRLYFPSGFKMPQMNLYQ
jgi:hypothetical protein